MFYERFRPERFFNEITTEAAARDLIWRSRFDGEEFKCPRCRSTGYYEIATRPEVRTCRQCRRQTRLRAGTIFDSSKTSLLLWVKALFYVMQGKRGISATELQRHLELKSYGRVWGMLQKIRGALQQRDENYEVGAGVVELDGGVFGKRETGNQCSAFVAIETKDWVDQNGKPKSKAGFAKVLVAKETKENAQKLVDHGVRKGAMINTDGKFKNLERVDHDYQVVAGKPEDGTHHGVRDKYLAKYLGEYTYRFNRRHDVGRLFHRALTACVLAEPIKLCALC